MENVIWFHTIFSSVVPKTLLPKRVLAPTDFGHSLIHHYQSRTKLFCTVGAYVEKTRQLVDIRRTHTYYSSLRRSSLSLLKDLSCSSPLHYIEGVYRRGVPEWVPTGRVLRVGHQKPPTFLTGGGFVLGGRRGFIAAALRLPQPDLQ
ncbi:hypothetical protein T4A_12280 [Trichinella pseudospiralis]|uniref:Uncharacterized protein n=1 Tax=Trichinella pseudospiralis TaxID=6337 RepID=A0A0V1K9K8_TRIPS|nr:hypothetical protein T4A_12280 [Trichinella pseudospiralis]KRZ43923.1 hypothetical protein T4C_13728 [Trichinella pseudospiralis]